MAAQKKDVPLRRLKNKHTISEDKIKFDRRNYRRHSDENKRIIRESLQRCGAGRSVVVDKDGELIAGNGVYEQAQALGLKTRVIETDGTELVVVKRTDLATEDERRKQLALADNAASDKVDWNTDLLRADFSVGDLATFGVELPKLQLDSNGEYEDKSIEMTEYERAQILSVEDEYIIVKCKPSEFDDMRKHFGLGFVAPLEQGVKYRDKKVKARVVIWSDYVNSDTKQEQTV